MQKYILREYLIPVFYCLLTFSAIQIICDLFDHLSEFMGAKTPIALISRYYLLMLMSTFEYIIPASVFLATLYTLWQFARHNEITAMRASGLSFNVIVTPILAVGLFFSISSLIIKETVSPWAIQWTRSFSSNNYKVPEEIIRFNQAFYNTLCRRQWLIDKLDLKKPHQLIGVSIIEEREDHSKLQEIFAEKAEWLDGQWWLFEGQINQYNAVGAMTNNRPISPYGEEMQNLTEEPSVFLNEIKKTEFLSSFDIIKYLRDRPNLAKTSKAKMKVYLHQRFALPWACFIATLFAIPMGAKSGRQNALVGVFLAVSFFFAFYMLTQVGMFLGIKRYIWPWLGAWLSNIICLIAGIGMLAKMK